MPFSRGLGKEILYICLSGFITLGIFYIARPVGFSGLSNLVLFGYGMVCIGAGVFYLVITHYLYDQFWSGKEWTVGLETFHSLLFLLFVATAIMIYGNIVGTTDLSFKTLLIYIVYTLSLGLVPVLIRVILVRNWRLKNDLVEVKKINALLGNRKDATDVSVLEFHVSKKESIRLTNHNLLFIESRENYLSLCWDSGNEIKRTMIRMTMKDVLGQISDPFIVPCHRSFIVNLRKVKEISIQDGASFMVLKAGEKPLPLSATYKPGIKQKLMEAQE